MSGSARAVKILDNKTMANFREKNGFWKGGRTIASNGYVLIKVGFDHHLADVRGYAYEHRLVAEEKIGRRLKKGELVHHIDHDKQNNKPENLEIVASIAEHRFQHRKKDSNRIRLDEKNSLVQCACGCQTHFQKYDCSGRPRKFISGHNPPASETQDQIIELLSKGICTLKEMSEVSGKNIQNIAVCASKMKKAGKIKRVSKGKYEIL